MLHATSAAFAAGGYAVTAAAAVAAAAVAALLLFLAAAVAVASDAADGMGAISSPPESVVPDIWIADAFSSFGVNRGLPRSRVGLSALLSFIHFNSVSRCSGTCCWMRDDKPWVVLPPYRLSQFRHSNSLIRLLSWLEGKMSEVVKTQLALTE